MAGNKAGGRKAAITNKEKYGKEFYAKIGARGGKALVPKGFAINRELASVAGAIGGTISKRKQRLISYDKRGNPQYQRTA